MVGLLVYAAKGRKPAPVRLASPRPFLGHGKRQGIADDSMARFASSPWCKSGYVKQKLKRSTGKVR